MSANELRTRLTAKFTDARVDAQIVAEDEMEESIREYELFFDELFTHMIGEVNQPVETREYVRLPYDDRREDRVNYRQCTNCGDYVRNTHMDRHQISTVCNTYGAVIRAERERALQNVVRTAQSEIANPLVGINPNP